MLSRGVSCCFAISRFSCGISATVEKSLLVHHFSAVPSKNSDAWLDVCARAPVPSQRQRLLVAYDSVAASTSLPVYKWREPGETLQTPLESRVEEVV